jgi:hypothetical protein
MKSRSFVTLASGGKGSFELWSLLGLSLLVAGKHWTNRAQAL